MDQLNHAMMIANQVRVGRDIRHTFVERNGLGPHTPQEHRFHTLDGMRGIAALMVMAYHYYSRASLPFLRNTFIAVDFFFILSGFVITHAYASKLQGGMRGADYFVRRIARLLPTAVVGVLIGLPTLWLLIRNGHATYSLSDFVISTVSNLLMLPFLNEQSKFFDGPATVTGQLFPADDPLWSIFAELVASASFLILVRSTSKRLRWFCLTSLLIFIGAAIASGISAGQNAANADLGWNTSTFAGLFPRVFFGFSCGILIHRAMQPTFTKRLPPALARVLQNPLLPALLLICTLAMPLRLHGAYSLFSIALLAPSLVVLGATASSRNIAINKASEFLGWISFPVYCLHRPVLSAVRDMADGSAAPWSRVISPEVTAMVLTIMISILLTRLIDRLQVQRRLVRRWQGALPQ